MNDLIAWGNNPPEFIRVLADIVEESGSYAAAGRRLGINRASVSTLLANKYPANTQRMANIILAFASATHCPVLGEISAKECQAEREKPFIASNPQRIALYRACSQCPLNPKNQERKHG